MKTIRYLTMLTAVVLFALLPVSLFAAPKKAGPIVVTINDVPNGAPVIQVHGAPNGYAIYTGTEVADPATEDGALIVLTGVNNYFEDPDAALPDWGGRFTDARPWESLPPLYPWWGDPGVNYRQWATAVDIVWIEHDFDIIGNGDLRVGFNSRYPGGWYGNGGIGNSDEDLGPVTNNWVEVYTSDILVVRFKPHTYTSKK